MTRKCPIRNCERQGQPTMIDNMAEHLLKDHGTKHVKMDSQECVIELTYSKLQNSTEDPNIVQVPIMVEYEGAHFLLAINCVAGRRYFWMFFCEDGIMSGGRHFYGRFALLSPGNTVSEIRSERNVILPPSRSVGQIMETKKILFSIDEKGMRKYFVANDIAQLAFRVQELKKQSQPKASSSRAFEKAVEISTGIQNLQPEAASSRGLEKTCEISTAIQRWRPKSASSRRLEKAKAGEITVAIQSLQPEAAFSRGLEKADEISTAIQSLKILKSKLSPVSSVSKDKCFNVTCLRCGFMVGKLTIKTKTLKMVMNQNNSPSSTGDASSSKQEVEQNPIGASSSVIEDNNFGNDAPIPGTSMEAVTDTYELTEEDIIFIKEMETMGIPPNQYAEFLPAFSRGNIEYQSKVEEAVRRYSAKEK